MTTPSQDLLFGSLESFLAWLIVDAGLPASVTELADGSPIDHLLTDAFLRFQVLAAVERECSTFPIELWSSLETVGDLYYYVQVKSGHGY